MSNQQHHKRIYIAGPMSGLPDCNRPAFHTEANHQRERGHIPLNPATLPEGLTQAEDNFAWYPTSPEVAA